MFSNEYSLVINIKILKNQHLYYMKKVLLLLLCTVMLHCYAQNSDFAENAITVKETIIYNDSTSGLSIILNNNMDATGFQFDLYLPKGFSFCYINTEKKGYSNVDIENHLSYNGHIINSMIQKDGALRVICFSLANKTFSVGESEAMVIPIKISSSIDSGEYPVVLKSIELSNAYGRNSQKIDSVSSKIYISRNVTEVQNIEFDHNKIDNQFIFTLSGQKTAKLKSGQIGIVGNKKVLIK